MTYIQKEVNILASSDPANGALNLSADLSSFDVNFSTPLRIPATAKNVLIRAEQNTIWNTVLNINTGINDTLFFDDGAPKTVVVPAGLYDIVGLNSAISRELVNQGVASDLMVFTGDTASQKVIITISDIGTEIDFSVGQTFRVILGFNSQVITSTVVFESFTGDNVAAFNTILYFLIHSSLTDRGFAVNNTYNQTIAQVLITVVPGSQIVDQPFRPATSSAANLKGSIISTAHFFLTDDQQNPVDTNSEVWSTRVKITWLEKI